MGTIRITPANLAYNNYTWTSTTWSANLSSATAGTNAGTMPAEKKETPMAIKPPDLIPGYRADGGDTVVVVDAINSLVQEVRTSNLLAALDLAGRYGTFSSRQVSAMTEELNARLFE